MRWLWLWMVGVGLIIGMVSVVGEDIDVRCKEEKQKHFDSPIPNPTTEDLTGSIKHKRCSYNLKNPNMKASERKEQAEKRRLELLCKFCNKSETRMNKIPLCKKKCISDIPDPTDNPILKSAKQNIIKKSIDINSLEGKAENIPRWSLTDRLAHLDALTTNQNIRESVVKLITSPLTSTRNMLHMPQATKETMKSDKQLNTDWSGGKPLDSNILGSYPIQENRRNILQELHLPQATKDSMKNDKQLNTEWSRGKTIDRNVLERYYMPHTTKETMKNDKPGVNNWGTKTNDANILGSYPSKIPATYNTESDNFNQITRDSPFHSSSFHHDKEINPTNEIIRSKRLKDIRHLTHEDFVKILKDALHSKENLQSTGIQKRDSILAEGKEKFKQAFLHVLPHQTGVEYDEGVDIDEYKKNAKAAFDAEYEEFLASFGKKVTSNEEEETSTSSTKYTKEEMTTEISTSEKVEIGTELTNNTEINFDDILEQASPNIVEDFSQINKESTIRNNLEITTETIVSEDLNINTISPKPTNITKIETKKPSLIRQAIENLRNKHVILKKQHRDPDNISTNEPTSNINTLKDIELHEKTKTDLLTNPTQNTEHETKIISTRSTRDVIIQEKDPTTPKNTNSDDVKVEFLDKQNIHGIIKKVLPTTFTNPNLQSPLLNPDGKDAIFKNHLNMDPKINTNKYKDIALSMKNNVKQNDNNRNSNPNDVLHLHNCENDLRNPIHQDRNIYLTENRINLPLILKQKEDGTIQLLLDKSICDYCLQSEAEKYVFKRKTENNLSKYPLHIFNILDKHNDHSSKNINNYLQMVNNENINEELIKEQFYKYLIDEQLYKLFETLNIPVESSAELHSYVDDLSDDEKNKLKDYLLTSISNNYSSKDGNKINEELYNQKQTEFLQSILYENTESTTESNRITLQIKSEDDLHSQPNTLKIEDDNILRSFIRDQILNEMRNSNLCPICEKEQCMCKSNSPANYPRNNYYNEGRIIDKRHYIHPPVGNILTDQDDLTQKKYKIVNNFLNWARDVVVPDKKH